MARSMAFFLTGCAFVCVAGCQNGNNADKGERRFVEKFECIEQMVDELARADAEDLTSRQLAVILGSPDVKVDHEEFHALLMKEHGDAKEKRAEIMGNIRETWDASLAMRGHEMPSKSLADAVIWLYRWNKPVEVQIVSRGLLFEHGHQVRISYFALIHGDKIILCSSLFR